MNMSLVLNDEIIFNLDKVFQNHEIRCMQVMNTLHLKRQTQLILELNIF